MTTSTNLNKTTGTEKNTDKTISNVPTTTGTEKNTDKTISNVPKITGTEKNTDNAISNVPTTIGTEKKTDNAISNVPKKTNRKLNTAFEVKRYFGLNNKMCLDTILLQKMWLTKHEIKLVELSVDEWKEKVFSDLLWLTIPDDIRAIMQYYWIKKQDLDNLDETVLRINDEFKKAKVDMTISKEEVATLEDYIESVLS